MLLEPDQSTPRSGVVGEALDELQVVGWHGLVGGTFATLPRSVNFRIKGIEAPEKRSVDHRTKSSLSLVVYLLKLNKVHHVKKSSVLFRQYRIPALLCRFTVPKKMLCFMQFFVT
jgi:hypothetical protein